VIDDDPTKNRRHAVFGNHNHHRFVVAVLKRPLYLSANEEYEQVRPAHASSVMDSCTVGKRDASGHRIDANVDDHDQQWMANLKWAFPGSIDMQARI
jgi:hypothetical protein